MNKTQKIALAIGVGIGVAYLYRKYMMPKKATAVTDNKTDNKTVVATPTTSMVTEPKNRAEKEEYIIDNAMASQSEMMSGMDGVKFVFNPQLGKFYPTGTLTIGEEPAYMQNVFSSANGEVKANLPNAVAIAERSVKSMNDEELELAYLIVKYCKENPSSTNDMQKAITGLNITNPRLIEFINKKLSKKLNDIKIAKKDVSWDKNWSMRKESRKKARKDFFDKVGVDKDVYDKAVAKVCGVLKPNARYTAEKIAGHRQCSENVATKLRKMTQNKTRKLVDEAPVEVKSDIANLRQKQFQQQVVNRSTGGMFAGERWDGNDNTYTETLVSEGLT